MRVMVVAAPPAAAPTMGKDSLAARAMGGFELLPSDTFERHRAVLFIRPDGVRLCHVVRNREAAPVDAPVALPLPPLGDPFEFGRVPIPVEDDANRVGFTTRVGGRPVACDVEARALRLGLARTAQLHDLGMPLAPLQVGIADRLAALPDAVRASLADALQLARDGRPMWQPATTSGAVGPSRPGALSWQSTARARCAGAAPCRRPETSTTRRLQTN